MTEQVWECATCGFIYRSPMPVAEVWCNGKPKCRGKMKVISGPPSTDEIKKEENATKSVQKRGSRF